MELRVCVLGWLLIDDCLFLWVYAFLCVLIWKMYVFSYIHLIVPILFSLFMRIFILFLCVSYSSTFRDLFIILLPYNLFK